MVGIVAGAKTKGTSLDGVDVGGRLSGNPLFEKIAALGYDGLESWAWANYRATILAFARQAAQRNARPPRLLEVGGGRDPLFRPEEARALGLDVTVNDIDADELARAQAGAYDLIFSQMVFEHVAGVEKAWRNVHTLLAEGGVGLAFVPTLYAPPF